MGIQKDRIALINRRKTLALLGGAGAAVLFNGNKPESVEAATCTPATPTVTEGPYWVDEKLLRSDIRTDPSTGVAREGIPLSLAITVQNLSGSDCAALVGAYVDIWHCDAIGIYSDESTYNPGGGTGSVNTKGQKFLRGYQITGDSGQVRFTTIYPGWYSGRTIHIHVRIRTVSGSTVLDDFVSQIFFDETINNTVLAQTPYSNRTSARDTTNARDMVYTGAQNPTRMLANTSGSNAAGYSAAITIGVSLATPAATAPAVTSGGIANAASGTAGLTPASWISIYGVGLASTARTMAGSDLVNGSVPTSLGGVSANINGKAAFIFYVSPTQINVLSPSDASTGPVAVTVTNSSGTSAAVNATLQSVLPGLFTASNYVRAVRPSDGAIVNGTGAAESGYTTATAAKPGDTLELFGTGFGATTPAMAAGLVFTGAYPTTNPVTVTVGNANAPVSFAGLVGPGLYQINVTVPAGLADADHAVVASVGGSNSQSNALLKVRNS